MPLKSIVLHMGPDALRRERLDIALAVAARHGAHLELVYVTAPAGMPAGVEGRGASYAYMLEATAIAEEKAESIRAEAEEACARAGVPFDWRLADGEHNDVLTERSHYADLVILHRGYGVPADGHVGLNRADDLTVTAACPLLLLPHGTPAGRAIGDRVLVAWKPSREAARAVRESLPFLERASHVSVLTCTGARDGGPPEIVAFLARHGVQAEHVLDVGDEDVGPVILAHAANLQADLLVMGAYGHSRFRETVLGGVTRHVIAHLPLPALLAH